MFDSTSTLATRALHSDETVHLDVLRTFGASGCR